MRSHTCVPLLLVLAFACTASGQVKPNSAAAAEASAQQPGSTSKTYDETIRMLKTQNNADLARLFTEDSAGNSDFFAAWPTSHIPRSCGVAQRRVSLHVVAAEPSSGGP